MAMVSVLDVIADVAQVCKKCPNGTLQRAYIRSARALLTESRWHTSILPAALTIGQQSYDIGSDPYEEIIGVQSMSYTQSNGQQQPVFVSDPGGWRPNPGQGAPRLYAYIPEGQLAVHPLPDQAYPVTINLVIVPKAGQNSLDDRVLRKWDRAIQAGTLAYLHSLKGEPWYDPNEAIRQGKIHQAAINNAKAEVQRRYQAGSQRATPRAFI